MSKALRKSLKIYLVGRRRHARPSRYVSARAAEQWWESVAVKPGGWNTQIANNAAVANTTGAKALLLTDFQKGKHKQYQEGKLRNRRQAKNETAVSYFYDVISLCKSVDPAMDELTKINYLMGGLNPELTTRLYVQQIDTADKFLKTAKLDDEAFSMAKEKRDANNEFVVAAINFAPTTKSSRDKKFAPALSAAQKDGIKTKKSDINSKIDSLQKELKELDVGGSSQSERPALICYGCQKLENLKRDCHSKHLWPRKPKTAKDIPPTSTVAGSAAKQINSITQANTADLVLDDLLVSTSKWRVSHVHG